MTDALACKSLQGIKDVSAICEQQSNERSMAVKCDYHHFPSAHKRGTQMAFVKRTHE